MRLEPWQVSAIGEVFDTWWEGMNGVALYLYGSRVDDRLKGGDIDLACLIPDERYDHFASRKHVLLAALKERLGEQRIDVSVLRPSEAEDDVFWRGVLPDAILLRQVRSETDSSSA